MQLDEVIDLPFKRGGPASSGAAYQASGVRPFENDKDVRIFERQAS